jgi:glycosyltransferase involved in cell wall biosynthesis
VSVPINVIIPSRQQKNQIDFLTRAIASVQKQSTLEKYEIIVTIAVDKGCKLEKSILDNLGAQCVVSEGSSQAAALNAGIDTVKGGYVAFLEDDDQWEQNFLQIALMQLENSDFISSTQAEYDENGMFRRINDFPTPSGWVMRAELLHRVGKFNEEFKFHIDNEWLGRLKQKSAKRVHLTEATAPVEEIYCRQVRPWLSNVINLSGGLCVLKRHSSPYPLIRRLVHEKSGIGSIARDPNLQKISTAEISRIREMFGTIPW